MSPQELEQRRCEYGYEAQHPKHATVRMRLQCSLLQSISAGTQSTYAAVKATPPVSPKSIMLAVCCMTSCQLSTSSTCSLVTLMPACVSTASLLSSESSRCVPCWLKCDLPSISNLSATSPSSTVASMWLPGHSGMSCQSQITLSKHCIHCTISWKCLTAAEYVAHALSWAGQRGPGQRRRIVSNLTTRRHMSCPHVQQHTTALLS